MGTMTMDHFLAAMSVWALPILLSITVHEAAHAWMAFWRGDPTAALLGRATLNPLPHIDPVGTLLLPGLLVLMQAPILFGWAKPVPVNYARLRKPRQDAALVAVAGPVSNIILAFLAALALHLVEFLPSGSQDFVEQNLHNMMILSVILAVFNMLPMPPLDGGRILVALLPTPLDRKVAALERYWLFVIIGLLIVVPAIAPDFRPLEYLVGRPAGFVLHWILMLAGG